MLLAAIGVSGFFSKRNIEKIEVVPSLSIAVYCCEETLIELNFRNKRFYPRFALWIKKENENIFLGDLKPKGERNLPVRHIFAKRGYNSFPGINLWSEFPLGLVRRSKNYSFKDRLLVYPRIYKVLPHFPEEIKGEGENKPSPKGTEEFHYIREIEEGETRRIYWKGYARTGNLMEKVMGGTYGERIIIALDPYGTGKKYEENISLVASLGYYLWNERVFHFIFSEGFQGEVNEKNFELFMRSLALLPPGNKVESQEMAKFIRTEFPESTVFAAITMEDSPLKAILKPKELVFIK